MPKYDDNNLGLGEPSHPVYTLTKEGTLAILRAVDQADTMAAAAKASQTDPCDAVRAYLDASFLGPFFRSVQVIPYAENANVLGTYIKFLDDGLSRGESYATELHQIHLKLLSYVLGIEASAPLLVFGNCVEYLACKRKEFDFGIYDDEPSARRKLEAIYRASRTVMQGLPERFRTLLRPCLDRLIDGTLRNAVAHSNYRVLRPENRVQIWRKGQLHRTLTLDEVEDAYTNARYYQWGFIAAVRLFAESIDPDCPYIWDPGVG